MNQGHIKMKYAAPEVRSSRMRSTTYNTEYKRIGKADEYEYFRDIRVGVRVVHKKLFLYTFTNSVKG